ncbi:MAG: hypothetical protein POH28_01335 [Acidocella sp.]|nr:hypothetical protein [Acidocella sp.]
MVDLALQFGGDLAVGPTGDLLTAGQQILTQQRVLRRLLTNPGDYIWQLNYGAGLAQFVGRAGAPSIISGITRAQMMREPAVARDPAPVVSVVAGDDGMLALSVHYTNSSNGQKTLLAISL